MSIPPLDAFHPAARRTLGGLRLAIAEGRAAFFLGAGVDTQLAIDALAKPKPLMWTDLLLALGAFPPASRCGLKDDRHEEVCRALANDWPQEVAAVARYRLGDQKFQKTIRSKLDHRFKPRSTADFTKALGALLASTNLIVTPNYSGHVRRALEAHLAAARPGTRVVILDREDLPGFPFPEPRRHPECIYVVHLHGRCSGHSTPVLDAWGYNVVQNDDDHYVDFLEELFTSRSVVTIGLSWIDIPVRNAAAFVQRTKPYMRPNHLAYYFVGDAKMTGTERHPAGPHRAWAAAMRACYGADFVHVCACDQPSIVSALSQEGLFKPLPPQAVKSFDDSYFKTVAEFLDQNGDYESPVQQEWLQTATSASRSLPSATVNAKNSRRLAKKLISWVQGDPARWEVCARIERHLRHHLWLGGSDARTVRDLRVGLWKALADVSTRPACDERLLFDFLVGVHELKARKPVWAPARLADPLLQARLELGGRLWTAHKANRPEREIDIAVADLGKAANEALDLGWESMAAKVLLDAASLRAKATNMGKGMAAPYTVDLAQRAEAIARSVGCFRRAVKADVLAAMWGSNAREGRTRLLGRTRAVDTGSGLEPALLDGLAAALAVCHLSATRPLPKRALKEEIESVVNEAGIDWNVDNVKNYWLNHAPDEAAKKLRQVLT